MWVGNTMSCEKGISIIVIPLAVLFCALSIPPAGCGHEEVVRDDPFPPPPPMPENLMKFWANAYELEDLDKYASCLSDNFTHTFSPANGEAPDSTIVIDREVEMESARKLFEDSCVTRIEMDVPIADGPWPSEEGILFRLNPEIRITVGDVGAVATIPVTWAELKELIAEGVMPCEPAVYEVASSYFYIEIIEDPADIRSWLIADLQETLK